MRCRIKIDPASYAKRGVLFGFNDHIGRPIGVAITTANATATESETGYGIESPAIGDILGARVIITRNHIERGPLNKWKWFTADVDRDAFIAKQVSETRKRYARTYL